MPLLRLTHADGIPRLAVWFGLWLLSEFLALMLVVHAVGWTGALLLGLLTSVAGIVTLRRLGAGAVRGLRGLAQGQPIAEGALMDGTLSGLGAVLLIVPGFVSDVVGLALAAPSLRQWIVRLNGRPSRRGPRVLDLSPDEWRPLSDQSPRR